MPIYEYVCDTCSEAVEVLQKRNAPAPECPSGDGGQLVRVLSAHAVGVSRGGKGSAPPMPAGCGQCPDRGGCGIEN